MEASQVSGLAGFRRVGGRVLPDPQEDVLEHLFGHGPIPDDTQHDPEEFRRGRVVEGLEGAPVPSGDGAIRAARRPLSPRRPARLAPPAAPAMLANGAGAVDAGHAPAEYSAKA